ncbi:LOW QUALITY PROTEIN: centrosomal protein of 295 kDa [Menidia menidia]
MQRKVSRLRLSPNEEARIIREEYERRRKLRIQQVREQQKYISLKIRREVEQRRKDELQKLELQLREDWETQQKNKLETLERLYQESLQLVGQGHRSAKDHEPDLEAIAQREEQNQAKAEERFQEALKQLKTQRLEDVERQKKSTVRGRRRYRQKRKDRLKWPVFLHPPPKPTQDVDPKRPRVLKRSDVSAFAGTRFHIPENAVDRETGTEQRDAVREAELEARRLQEVRREEKRRREELQEKARLRGREALRREQLAQDRERLLVELEHLQQTDLLRRRQQVSQMPPQIFQPLYQRQEAREDFQRELEFAFEDMYTGERRVKGDLVVRLVPEPLPALSIGSQDQELDVTMDESAFPAIEDDSQPETGSSERETSAEAPAPRRALKRLLDRIRTQRSEQPPPGSLPPPGRTDQVPERDSSIETGSLLSEEKQLHEPVLPPNDLEPTKQPRVQEYEDVQQKREDELEREKQQQEDDLEREKQRQVSLLLELEEQKVRLEQMLAEAQQERENLKAAVDQEAAINEEEAAINEEETAINDEEEIPSVPSESPSDGDGRVREYQRRLLEQNRIHQRSVEVARQRLLEYQRALTLRWTTRSLMAAPPPHLLLPAPPHVPVLLPISQ